LATSRTCAKYSGLSSALSATTLARSEARLKKREDSRVQDLGAVEEDHVDGCQEVVRESFECVRRRPSPDRGRGVRVAEFEDGTVIIVVRARAAEENLLESQISPSRRMRPCDQEGMSIGRLTSRVAVRGKQSLV
jgi:hypothetical protein